MLEGWPERKLLAQLQNSLGACRNRFLVICMVGLRDLCEDLHVEKAITAKVYKKVTRQVLLGEGGGLQSCSPTPLAAEVTAFQIPDASLQLRDALRPFPLPLPFEDLEMRLLLDFEAELALEVLLERLVFEDAAELLRPRLPDLAVFPLPLTPFSLPLLLDRGLDEGLAEEVPWFLPSL